jgi:outer membrane protein TolC
MTDGLKRFLMAMKVCTMGLACLLSAGQIARAQDQGGLPSAPTPSPTLMQGPYQVQLAAAGPLSLGLDDAITRGVAQNLQVKLAKANELTVHGSILSVGNALLPNMQVVAQTGTQEINLAAEGFKGSSLAAAGFTGTFNTIVKVDVTSVELTLNQQLFNVPAYYLFRAAQRAERGAELTTLNAEGGVVLAVGTYYLRALADSAQIENARALEKEDQEILRQATDSHDAGVGTNIDVIRARVQLQTQQQVVINAENTFEKDKIALNRQIGIPADQAIALTDKVPYAEYATMPLSDALVLAYQRRKDLLNLQSQISIAEETRKAVRAQRYPTLAFGGYYGVVGQTQGLYHGSFVAQGTVQVPIFMEATLRGQGEIAGAQLTALRQQEASLKVTIDQQIRAAMLDVQSSGDLVKVAQSNVDLASQVLHDATDRYTAGVDDNLPVVQAQATLANAQSRLIQTMFQYNQSKLTLARNTGVVETQYKTYLGR